MKILLVFDKKFNIDKKSFYNFLNKNTRFLNFSIGDDIDINSDVLSKPDSFKFIREQIHQEIGKFDRVFCVTEKPYDDNYFFHEYYDISIFSFWAWSYLTNLPKSNGLLYFIVDYLALYLDKTGFRHDDITGCIYDFLWQKNGIDDGMRQAKICPACLERVTINLFSQEKKDLLEDLKLLMNLLSDSSKWNQDILKNTMKGTDGIKKRKSKCEGQINIVIASPGDTLTERNYLLDKLEVKFRRDNLESHCSKRLIVHGWEDLASQSGYPQDIINSQIISKVDIVIAVFKHKLGTPTIDVSTGEIRATSGTVEELLTSLDNSKVNKPLGMAYFFSKAPVVSLDSKDIIAMQEDWNKLETFKRELQSKMIYKPYVEPNELLQTILTDLEKNIIQHFE